MVGECNQQRTDCPYLEQGCYSDTHHEFFPKHKYRTKLERAFRNLTANTVQICRAEHDEIHATIRPPKKPSRQEMKRAVDGT